MPSIFRPDKNGSHRANYEKNRKRILATQCTCGICGRALNFEHKPPHPLAPCIDHIIPIAKGGPPSDIDNLQLAHYHCNRRKSDKLFKNIETSVKKVLGNRKLN